MFVASDEATSGSVIEKHDRISPSSSGCSHCSCCSGVPNMASSSMFPVSGAAQFIASGAIIGLRPEISASGAYSRLDRPGAERRVGQEQVPQPAVAGLLLQVLDRPAGVVQGDACGATCSAKTGSAG